MLTTVYCLPTKENKLPFSISVCSKQTEVAVFRWFLFLFAEFRKHRDMDLETWKHGDGDIDMGHGAWRNEDMET